MSKLCLWGCCSNNHISSYNFGKKVSEKLVEVKDLQSKWVFEVVAERVLGALAVACFLSQLWAWKHCLTRFGKILMMKMLKLWGCMG
ncbi:hypothetical protein TIFTF001_027961 [Ficus carica]|uniref:Uncharacterized protein n=1 Tax=Ficus carica TaxID=3494 RepID=A0AA88DP08_FICCA|nr:hypothetical protein TIFTF001_027961 [Ficus carica]